MQSRLGVHSTLMGIYKWNWIKSEVFYSHVKFCLALFFSVNNHCHIHFGYICFLYCIFNLLSTGWQLFSTLLTPYTCYVDHSGVITSSWQINQWWRVFLNSHSRPFVHILRAMWVGRCSVCCILRTHHTVPIKYALVLKVIWFALQLLQCGLRRPPAMNFGLKRHCFHRFRQCLHLFNECDLLHIKTGLKKHCKQMQNVCIKLFHEKRFYAET